MEYDRIVQRSLELSKPYWDLYEKLIGSKLITPEAQTITHNNQDKHSSGEPGEQLNPEYLKLMQVTREHRAKREKQKRQRQKKGLDVETYYRDISQVDTLVEDNLVEAPDRNAKSSDREPKMIELYGGLEAYESVRSLEMTIDDYFHRKCQELKPGYWPVIPIKHRRYLNSIER